MTSGGIWNAYGIEVRWQSTSSATPAAAAATTTPAATTTQNQSSSYPSDVSPGLPTGAKVGIGIGVAAGGILILLALGFFILRRKRHRGGKFQQLDIHELEQFPKQPLAVLSANDGAAKGKSHQPRELASTSSVAGGSNAWQEPAELEVQEPVELEVPGSTKA